MGSEPACRMKGSSFELSWTHLPLTLETSPMRCVRRALILAPLLLPLIAGVAVAQEAPPDSEEAFAAPPQSMPTDSTVNWTQAAPETRERIKKRLGKIVFTVARPEMPFELAEDGTSEGVSAYTGLIKGTPRWAPIEAWSERDFQAVPTNLEEGEYRTLEILVALNGVRGLSLGIASKSDKPHLFNVPGAIGIEQSTIGGVDTTRTDLAPEERRTQEPISLLRVYIVGGGLEAQIRERFQRAGGFPGFGSAQLPSDHPDMVRSIVVEFYGAKSDVEALAKKLDVVALRKLLE